MSRWSIDNARLEWGEDGLPRSTEFGDVYFSRHDPMAETAHVFLDGNHLHSRFPLSTDVFVIAELGFGTGLNFLSAWRLWDGLAPPGTRLHFISCEQFPLLPDDLRRSHALWPSLAPWAGALQSAYPAKGAGQHRLVFNGRHGPVILDLLYGEAGVMLADLAARAPATVDAWFLDGFAPRCNPAMWQSTLFRHMARLSRPGCTLATYSVAAPVREGLEAAGFTVRKSPGYGSKRHMLQGERNITDPPNPAGRPATTVTVVGAGLAGSACAYALAMRGLAVTVLERAVEPAAGPSGNPQGALFLPLHRDANARAALLAQAARFAARHYARLEAQGLDIEWHPCGALQLHERNGPGFFDRVETNPLYAQDTVRRISAGEASALAGVAVPGEGLMLPQSGWLNPSRLCRAQLSVAGITVHCSSPVTTLERRGGQWCTLDDHGRVLSSSDALIIANAHDAPGLLPGHQYPLFPNRGQISFVRAGQRSRSLASVLCGTGYLLPAREGLHTLGSSFEPRATDTTLRESDHRHNMALLSELAPSLAAGLSDQDIQGGRASLRCTTRDYLPLAGAVEDIQATLTAGRQALTDPVTMPGLYLCSGFGSHGITTTPLLADHLASLIAGSISPLDGDTARLVVPGRFLLRRMKSGDQSL